MIEHCADRNRDACARNAQKNEGGRSARPTTNRPSLSRNGGRIRRSFRQTFQPHRSTEMSRGDSGCHEAYVLPENIQRIFQHFIEVQTPKLIARKLNRDGIKTKPEKIWDATHIYRILGNHTCIGEVKYKDTICEGEQEAIVDLAVWNRSREILSANDRTPDRSRNVEIVAPLKGILKCGHCGCSMIQEEWKEILLLSLH